MKAGGKGRTLRQELGHLIPPVALPVVHTVRDDLLLVDLRDLSPRHPHLHAVRPHHLLVLVVLPPLAPCRALPCWGWNHGLLTTNLHRLGLRLGLAVDDPRHAKGVGEQPLRREAQVGGDRTELGLPQQPLQHRADSAALTGLAFGEEAAEQRSERGHALGPGRVGRPDPLEHHGGRVVDQP